MRWRQTYKPLRLGRSSYCHTFRIPLLQSRKRAVSRELVTGHPGRGRTTIVHRCRMLRPRPVVLVPRARPGELQVIVLAVPEQLGFDGFRTVIGVNSAYRERQVLHHGPCVAAKTCTCALSRTLWFSVHPVATSVTVNVKQNSPRALPPSCFNQVDLHEARGVLLMISPRPHRDPGLQQRPGLGMRPALEDEPGPGQRQLAVDRSTGTISASSGASRLPAGALATVQHFSRAATTSESYFGGRRARALTTRGVSASRRARRA